MSFLYNNSKGTNRSLFYLNSASVQATKKTRSFLSDLLDPNLLPWNAPSSNSSSSSSSSSSHSNPNPRDRSRRGDVGFGRSHDASHYRAESKESSSSSRTRTSSGGNSLLTLPAPGDQRDRPARRVIVMKEGLENLHRIFDKSAGGLPEVNLYKFIESVANDHYSLRLLLGERNAIEVINEVRKLHTVVKNSISEYVSWGKMKEMMQNSTNLDFRLCHSVTDKHGAKEQSWSLERYKIALEKTGYEFSPRSNTENNNLAGGEQRFAQSKSYETEKEELNSPFKDHSMQQNHMSTSISEKNSSNFEYELHALESKNQVDYDVVSKRIESKMAADNKDEDEMDLDSEDEEEDEGSSKCINQSYQRFMTSLTPKQCSLVNERLTHPSEEDVSKVEAIFGGSQSMDHDVLIIKGGIDITQTKFKCLDSSTWLNDEPINFYMLMLKERDTKLCEIDSNRQPSWFFSSLFINRLMNLGVGGSQQYDYAGVKRWSKKFDVFAQKRIYMPVNINNSHWTLLVVKVDKKEIHFYDSMNGAGTKYLEAAQRWIVDEAKAKKNMIIDPNEYKLVKKQLSMPQQNNGYDCGVFSTMCADYLSDDLPLNCYSQTEMNMFRVKIGAAILRGSLNYSF